MNLERLQNELNLIVADESLEPYFTDWLNDAILELASDFELPKLRLKEPTTLEVTTSNWLYDMPAIYHKHVIKCRNSNGDQLFVNKNIQTIESLDLDHDETGDYVQGFAVEDNKLVIYPKANDTLSLWFYRLPVDMVALTSEPDGIPASYHERVILPKVIIKNFQLLLDMTVNPPHQSLLYWQNKYSEGLYGRPGGDVGMINYFMKSKSIRKHGGRDPLP